VNLSIGYAVKEHVIKTNGNTSIAWAGCGQEGNFRVLVRDLDFKGLVLQSYQFGESTPSWSTPLEGVLPFSIDKIEFGKGDVMAITYDGGYQTSFIGKGNGKVLGQVATGPQIKPMEIGEGAFLYFNIEGKLVYQDWASGNPEGWEVEVDFKPDGVPIAAKGQIYFPAGKELRVLDQKNGKQLPAIQLPAQPFSNLFTKGNLIGYYTRSGHLVLLEKELATV